MHATSELHGAAGGGDNDNNGNNGGGGDGNNGNGGEDDERPWPLSPFIPLIAGILVTAINLKEGRKKAAIIDTTSPVSIIVPALNEAKGITDAITYLKSLDPAPYEIIVADGGSRDDTTRLAAKAGAKVVRTRRGRARQMNAGADATEKKDDGIFLFVHSDSKPPRDAVALIRKTLSDPKIILGGFSTLIESDGHVLLFPTFHLWIKTFYGPLIFSPLQFFRGSKCMFGDQSLFCRKKDFWKVGQYDERLPIMEDADLCVRMHREGYLNGNSGCFALSSLIYF